MKRLVRLWRRSIRARVVISTLLLTTVVVLLTGWVLLRAVATGLAESRTDVALSEARVGFDRAQSVLDATVDDPGSPSQVLVDLVDTLASSRGDNRTFDLVVEGPLSPDGQSAPQRSSADFDTGSLPAELLSEVHSENAVIWQYSSLSALGLDDEPAVVVGKRIAASGSGEEFALFYVFSMADQVATLGLVRQALAWGGLALVALIGAIAWIVARQVVGPLRLARTTAERFASGHLGQRMYVRGEDDIARLSTSFNQMAASLESQIRRLENLSVLQQRFVSDVSHELRTPLTTVHMASDMLAEQNSQFTPQARRASQLLQRELERFESLLSDLLDLSRFDAGAAQLEIESVDLAAVARSVAADPALLRANVRAVAIDADRPATVDADPRRVDRIVRNLISNAIKYASARDLEVEVGRLDDCVSLAVRDFGVGMVPQDRQRVFDRFWRADPARSHAAVASSDSPVVGGTGLGLAIAREDAALHGGTLEVFSKRGEGTEFILTLPIVPGSVTRMAVAPRFV